MVAVLFLSPMNAFSEETKDEYRHQSFELYPNGKESEDIVTLEGMMPKGVKAEAVDVTEDFLDEDDSDSNKSSEVKSEEKSKSEESTAICLGTGTPAFSQLSRNSFLLQYDITVENLFPGKQSFSAT